MESAYTLANKELEQIRQKNHEEQNIRRNDAFAKVPRLGEIETSLMKEGANLLTCVLKKKGDFESIKKSIQSLQNERTKLLKKNGFPQDFLEDIFTCQKCGDTGYVDGKRCSCLKNLIVKHIGANSNLTEYMRKQTFENFDLALFASQTDDNGKTLKVMQKICDKALEFAEDFDKTGENFLIMGNAGTGKTYLTSCIANRALERGKTVYYQTAFKLFEYFENAKFEKDDDEAEAIKKYVYDVELLIIDDLGTEFNTQFTSAVFFDIINSRITAGKSTVISSNLDFDELSNMYSQRVTSRFLGEYKLYQTTGQDLRLVIRERSKKI